MKFVDARFIPYVPSRHLEYDQVDIINNFSTISIKDVNLTTKFGRNFLLRNPVISINCDLDRSLEMSKRGGLGILSNQNKDYTTLLNDCKELQNRGAKVGFTIGISPEDDKVIENLLKEGIKAPLVFIYDINGDHQLMIEQIRRLNLKYRNGIDIMAGNITLPVTVQAAVQSGVSAIFCERSSNEVTNLLNLRRLLFGMKTNVNLVADYFYGDAIKSFVAGADIVCCNCDTLEIDSYSNKLQNDLVRINSKNSEEAFNNGIFIERNVHVF